MSQGKLIIITGFLASGKDTVTKMLIERNPHFSKVVTHTSRPPRSGEVYGVDHHFITAGEFESMISSGDIIEHVIYDGHYKGTSRKEIEKVFENKDVIWRIDMTRTVKVEELFYQKFGKAIAESLISRTVKICLKTESKQVIFQRYKSRDPSSFNFQKVIKRFAEETIFYNNNKHLLPNVVINSEGKLDQTIVLVENIIKGSK